MSLGHEASSDSGQQRSVSSPRLLLSLCQLIQYKVAGNPAGPWIEAIHTAENGDIR